MKKAIIALIAFGAFLGTTPATVQAANPVLETAALRYSNLFTDGWPKWIGRLSDPSYLLATYNKKPELAPEYLPLALVRTGRFNEIVDEVAGTPNVDTSKWPAWIGELRTWQQ